MNGVMYGLVSWCTSQHSGLLFPKLHEIIVLQLEQESHEALSGEIEVILAASTKGNVVGGRRQSDT